MSGPYDDLDRPALREVGLRRDLAGPGLPWRELQVVGSTGSTNADLAAASRGGAAAGLVLIAEEQTAGRGRQDRAWSAPWGSGLTFSVLVVPVAVPSRWGWLPLLAGLGVAGPIARVCGLEVTLKWPNDVLVGERKLAGILAERVGDQVVIGVGINVSLRPHELPVPQATSLEIEGSAVIDRETVLRAVLRGIAQRLDGFDGSPAVLASVRADYRSRCATLGREVRAELPGGRVVEGLASDIDPTGRLLIERPDGLEAVAAADVIHLR